MDRNRITGSEDTVRLPPSADMPSSETEKTTEDTVTEAGFKVSIVSHRVSHRKSQGAPGNLAVGWRTPK